jgi:hypothetical protein
MERNAGADHGGHDEEPDRERMRDEEGRDTGAGREGSPGAGEPSEHDPERDPEHEPLRPRAEPTLPADEEQAWAQIVAAYGEEPADPADGFDGSGRTTSASGAPGDQDTGGTPTRSFTVYAAGTGPRVWSARGDDEEGEGEGSEDGEGHFEPPEPPPLPQADTTAKFAWLAAIGGPLLLILTIVFQVEMTWWIVILGIGGFLGGFATLVARMRDGRDDDDWDDPGRGAVV